MSKSAIIRLAARLSLFFISISLRAISRPRYRACEISAIATSRASWRSISSAVLPRYSSDLHAVERVLDDQFPRGAVEGCGERRRWDRSAGSTFAVGVEDFIGLLAVRDASWPFRATATSMLMEWLDDRDRSRLHARAFADEALNRNQAVEILGPRFHGIMRPEGGGQRELALELAEERRDETGRVGALR